MSSNERNNLEKEVEDAPTPLLDTVNEIETTVKNTTQDVSETVKKLAKESYERDLKEFDKQWGKGGIPTLVRDKI